MMKSFLLLALLVSLVSFVTHAFTVTPALPNRAVTCCRSAVSSSAATADRLDPQEIVARTIRLKGDVQGGYFRACVLNEAGKFRKLLGTMTPPDETDEAEIYVEGKRRQVDGFVRWCKKGDPGLSQVVKVLDVIEEEPTGLYDGFYCKVRGE